MNRLVRTARGLVVVALGAMLLPCSAPVEGGIVVTKAKVQEIADPTFRYTFTVEIDDDCELQVGNFFTIFDVFLPPDALALPDHPPTQPPGWVLFTPATGPSPFGPSPDDTAILNVSWLYTGPTIVGPIDLGEFTVTIEQPAPKGPTAIFVSECGPPGSGVAERGEVSVEFIPEPATVWSMAGGLGLLGAWQARRRGLRRAARAA